MVLNLTILQDKEGLVKSISHNRHHVQSISEKSETENDEEKIKDELGEIEKKEGGSKSVMLYTTIVFSVALAVRKT